MTTEHAESAAQYNASTYDALWSELTPFVRYNPGVRHRRRWLFQQMDAQSARGALRSVVDVGCGNGELLRLARERFPRVERWAGLDVSSETILRNARHMPDVRFIAADLQRDSVDDTFDLVLCTEVIEHLDDRRAAFKRLAAMLRPGGTLLVTCPAGRVYATERYFGHTTHPTERELRSLAAGEGLAVRSLTNWGFPLYRALKWATNVSPEWSLRNFAGSSYGGAQVAISHSLYLANFANAPSSPWGCQFFAAFTRA